MGISLSQLLVENPKPALSGIKELDDTLDGFQTRSIYEVFGPPGIGKTKLGLQILKNELKRENPCLWIDTHKAAQLPTECSRGKLRRKKITKFSHLVFFFQELEEEFSLIIIDGLSQILTDYLYANTQVSRTSSLHSFKNKNLITLFTIMTKYTHAKKATIVLLNDAMNTGYQENTEDRLVAYKDESQFLVRSQKKRSVQVLRSALVANIGVGSKDHMWEVFLKNRIGLFWSWDTRRSFARYPPKTRVAIVFDMAARDDDEHPIVRFTVDETSHDFISSDDESTDCVMFGPPGLLPSGLVQNNLSSTTSTDDPDPREALIESQVNSNAHVGDESSAPSDPEADREVYQDSFVANKRHKLDLPCTPRLRKMTSAETLSAPLPDPAIYESSDD